MASASDTRPCGVLREGCPNRPVGDSGDVRSPALGWSNREMRETSSVDAGIVYIAWFDVGLGRDFTSALGRA